MPSINTPSPHGPWGSVQLSAQNLKGAHQEMGESDSCVPDWWVPEVHSLVLLENLSPGENARRYFKFSFF